MNQKKTKKRQAYDYLYYVIRAAVLLSVVFLFIPSLNPARISGMINKNLSLFTSGISYSTLTNGFGRAFKKGWVSQESFMLDCAGAIVMCVGIALGVAAACMSLGNIRLKKLGNIFSLISGVVMTAGIVMISTAYKQISASEKVDKIEPMLPKSVTIMTVFAVILIISSIASILFLKKQKSEKKFEMETKYTLFLMLMPFLALVAVFSYLPLWGWRYAFFDYKAGDSLSMANFVGFKWFTELLKNPATVKDIGNVMKNTLGMSGIGILTSWMPMAFAIFLCEIKNLKFRRFVQTFTTVPNFISWVLVYSIATCIFSTDGFLSSILVNLGIWSEGHNLLMNGSHTWLKMWLWGTWKGIGWSAGRFQRMWHITVPGLIPTFCVLLLMSIANVLSNGMDQYLVFKNATNATSIRVLDLYVYELGIGQGSIPLTTVVSMLKSVISVTLLFLANNASKLIRGESIV